MKILVVSSTIAEIEKTMHVFEISPQSNEKFFTKKFLDKQVSFFITGVGSYAMMYNLTTLLQKEKFDIIINAGIAGSYDETIKIGDLVFIESEEIGDLGIDNNGTFNTLFDENFIGKNDPPFSEGKLICKHLNLVKNYNYHQVKSLSANTVGGEQNRINRIKEKFDVQVENMEGAAFFYVCILNNLEFVEIRAISNFVEPRNKENWQIMKAISNLNESLKIIILELLKL